MVGIHVRVVKAYDLGSSHLGRRQDSEVSDQNQGWLQHSKPTPRVPLFPAMAYTPKVLQPPAPTSAEGGVGRGDSHVQVIASPEAEQQHTALGLKSCVRRSLNSRGWTDVEAAGGTASLMQLEARRNELPQTQASVLSPLAVGNGFVCGFCFGVALLYGSVLIYSGSLSPLI